MANKDRIFSTIAVGQSEKGQGAWLCVSVTVGVVMSVWLCRRCGLAIGERRGSMGGASRLELGGRGSGCGICM